MCHTESGALARECVRARGVTCRADDMCCAPRQPRPHPALGKQPQKPPGEKTTGQMLLSRRYGSTSGTALFCATTKSPQKAARRNTRRVVFHEPQQAPRASSGEGHEQTGRSATAFARFTFALLVGRWRAFPVVFRLVWGSGQGGEASVCGGPASQCSLTPRPGPLAPLPRVIAPSGAPLTPRVSAPAHCGGGGGVAPMTEDKMPPAIGGCGGS